MIRVRRAAGQRDRATRGGGIYRILRPGMEWLCTVGRLLFGICGMLHFVASHSVAKASFLAQRRRLSVARGVVMNWAGRPATVSNTTNNNLTVFNLSLSYCTSQTGLSGARLL